MYTFFPSVDAAHPLLGVGTVGSAAFAGLKESWITVFVPLNNMLILFFVMLYSYTEFR